MCTTKQGIQGNNKWILSTITTEGPRNFDVTSQNQAKYIEYHKQQCSDLNQASKPNQLLEMYMQKKNTKTINQL